MSKQAYTVWTDGSWRPPNFGSYAVLIFQDDKEIACLSGPVFHCTINRMELLAIHEALAYFKEPGQTIHLISDSQYAVNCMTRWARHWQKNAWLTVTGDPVKNRDLIEKIYTLCQIHQVTFRWVRGHDGNKNNERCDKIAKDITRAMVAKTILPPIV